MIDALHEVAARANTERRAAIWTIVGAMSFVLILLPPLNWLPNWVQITMLVCGWVGFFLYLAYLSTTDFGKMLAEFFRSTFR